MKRDSKYMLDIVPGIVIAAFSLFYLVQIPGIQAFNGLGSTPLDNHFGPWMWGGALLFLGVWLIVRGFFKYKRFKAAGGAVQKFNLGKAISDKGEVIASFIALTIYVALLEPIGFVIMTIIYTFAQILILTPREKWGKNFLPAGIVAIIVGILLYYIFKLQLSVLLPSGILGAFGL